MRIFRIKKRSGGFREIFSPSADEKAELREILDQHLSSFPVSKSAHGFAIGRGIVTNALAHRGFAFSLCFDISDFFPSCTREMGKAARLSQIVLEKCFLPSPSDGRLAARQGLPTSPAIANIIAGPMDAAIEKGLRKKEIVFAYTRYADDLTVSFNEPGMRDTIVDIVSQTVSRCGFRLNKKKTRFQSGTGGNRREICGITVDEEIHTSRKFRRKLRAAEFQSRYGAKNGRQVRGLREFARLSPPRDGKIILAAAERERLEARRWRDAEVVAAKYGIAVPQRCRKLIEERELTGSVVITTDPAMMLGLSSFRCGWAENSCYDLVRRGVNFAKTPALASHSGLALAFLGSGKTHTLAGITRPEMAARVIIYMAETGHLCYGHVYGTREAQEILVTALKRAGIKSKSWHRGQDVAGNTPRKYELYLDGQCSARGIILSTSRRKAWKFKII